MSYPETFQVVCSGVVGQLDEDGDIVHHTEWASDSLPCVDAKHLKQNITTFLKCIKLWKHFRTVYSLSVEANQLFSSKMRNTRRAKKPSSWQMVLRSNGRPCFRHTHWISTGFDRKLDAYKAMRGLSSFLRCLKLAQFVKCFCSLSLESTQEIRGKSRYK